MVATESLMRDLGEAAPGFSLPDVTHSNQLIELSQLEGKPVLVMFICNHCPFVVHVMGELSLLANEFVGKGFAAVAISANDIDAYPQDAPEHMQTFANQYQIEFPYCFDESQQIAKDYGAVCTPDFFVFDASHHLVYRGQMDDSRPGNGVAVTGRDLRAAMLATLNGEKPDEVQLPSIGCNIKWRSA